mmetsp:Transcript_28575/g.51787  ORF Transcript_28575/g.51787 Transcript_28575/m.51787 type:complete len:632 (-) Transcript_28575:14-1909(-)
MAWEADNDDGFVPEVYEDSAVADTPRLPDPEAPVYLEEELGVPEAVQQILNLRRHEDDQNEDGPLVPALEGIARPTTEDWTPQLREFSSEVQRIKAAQKGPGLLDVKTYFDLQAYNLEQFAEKQTKQPGSILLMYMFYSRIFEKLVGKQKGVEVPLFAPVDFNARLLGFRAILEWARDFKVVPSRVPRRELERIYVTVHAGDLSSHEKFASKITYPEFVFLIVLCGNNGEPMDRSRLDGSRVRESEPRLEQVKRFASYLSLANSKKVKLQLHDAYRDVHFWKLSDGADFEKEARAAEMRSRPQYRVDCSNVSENDQEIISARKYMEHFTWCKQERLWEEFEAPCLDMGVSVIGGAQKSFRVSITNRGFYVAKLTLEVSSSGPLRLPWKDTSLGAGQSIDVSVEVVPMECGEWRGEMLIRAVWNGGAYSPGQQDMRVPTYLRVLQPHKYSEGVERRLPLHAPRPFRPGSAARISIDPASIHSQQLRAPTPHKSGRPSSASTNSSARPPRPWSSGQRPTSSREGGSTAAPSSRPLSGCPASSRGAPSSLGQVGRQFYGFPASNSTPPPGQAFENFRQGGRPRSAPLTSGPPGSQPTSARVRPSSASGVRSQSANPGPPSRPQRRSHSRPPEYA